MDKPNAFGFIGAGLSMEALHFLPDLTAVREMWLLVMGGVLLSIGGFVILREGWLGIVPHLRVLLQSMIPERAEGDIRAASPAVRSVRI